MFTAVIVKWTRNYVIYSALTYSREENYVSDE